MTEQKKNSYQTESNHPVDELLRDVLASSTPLDVEKRTEKHFTSLQKELAQKAVNNKKTLFSSFRQFRFAWASAGAACCVLMLILVIGILSHSTLTWADVKERFKAVRYFSATVYITENPLRSPEKIELWMGHGGKSRLHHEGKVYFSDQGKLLKAFHLTSGQEFKPEKHSKAFGILKTLGKMEKFSLDELLKTFCGEKTFSPPLSNADASIAKDLTVFDINNNRTPEWVRLWVLKNSGLPLRLRMWDPRNADTMDILFDYMKEQPDSAFDPDQFQQTALQLSQGRTNRIYAGIKDPGGQMMTPEDIFQKTGYHMPDLKEIGMTKDGVVWVLSTNSSNRTSDGHTFYGFGVLTDNLKQEYIFVPRGNRVHEDESLGLYIPLTYKTSYQSPQKLILTCTTQPDHYQQEYTIIGSIEVDTWQHDKPIPEWYEGYSPINPLQRVIREMRYRHNWDRFDQLLEKIEGKADENPNAFFRDRMRLNKLMKFKKYDEALGLAERLFEIIQDRLEDEPGRHLELVRIYAELLCANDQLDTAEQVIATMKSLLNKPGDYNYVSFITSLANFMSDRLRWDEKQIEKILHTDLDDKRFRPYLTSSIRRPSLNEDSRFQEWRQYVNKIAELYKDKSLPDKMDILDSIDPYDISNPAYEVPLPGYEGYSVSRFADNWKNIMQSYALAKKWGYEQLIQVEDELKDETFNYTVVVNNEISYAERYEYFMKQMNVTVVETTQPAKVWVARYDGRPLPFWREVRPLDAGHIKPRADYRGGGTHTTVNSLFDTFERVVNQTRKSVGKDEIIIMDKTGLPDKPGENQTYGSICLAYHYAFWEGKEGVELAIDWFYENFGITFEEEMRELPLHVLKRIDSVK